MFEGFLMQSGNRDSRHNPRLINFLRDSAIKSRNFGGYAVKETGYEIAETSVNRYGSQVPVPVKTGRLNEVAAFIKDPYGNPYIPGSSLKGAIRTILINEVFKVDNTSKCSIRHSVGSATGSERFRIFFMTFGFPTVSLLPTEKLILAQKWDYSAIKGEARALPIHRESLKPFTEVLFTITAEGEEAISLLDSLGKYAKQHYTHYKEHTF
jgi:CRISPR-associated protein Csm5